MLSGQLRERIEVFTETTPGIDKNKRKRTYEHIFYDRAEYNFASAAREFSNSTEMAGKTARFKVRWKSGKYNETMVIAWNNDYYTINGIEIDRKRTFMFISVTRAMPGTIEIAQPET